MGIITEPMITTGDFIKHFSKIFPEAAGLQPWQITSALHQIISEKILSLDESFIGKNGIAIHKTAVVESGAVLKAPVIIGVNCFVAANACLRGGVYLGANVKIGMGCEIKNSIIFNDSAVAHFNFIGDSIIGNNVNFEAGSVIANHFNERADKRITLFYNGDTINTNAEKFGALVGDNSKIGANAVLSPATVLKPNSIVKRLQLIDQQK